MTQSHAVFMHRVGTEVSVSVRMDKLGKNVEIVDIVHTLYKHGWYIIKK